MESSGQAAASPEERRLAASLTGWYSDWVEEELDELPGSFLLTDPAMPGHPIVYASRGLATLTGYARREVLGRNARVFQGAATVAGVREAVRGQRAHQVAILNYRRDSSTHWVLLHVAPVFHAADGRVLHFLAVQVPIPATPCVAARRPGRPAVFAACREEARIEEELPCASPAGEVFVDMDKRGCTSSWTISIKLEGQCILFVGFDDRSFVMERFSLKTSLSLAHKLRKQILTKNDCSFRSILYNRSAVEENISFVRRTAERVIAYRALYILNWIYRYFTEPHYVHWITWIAGFVQTLLYADFFYYYLNSLKNNVKLTLPA